MTIIEQYHKNGYFILKNFFKHSEIVLIENHVSQVFTPWFEANKKSIFDDQLVNMYSLSLPHHFSSSIERVKFFNAILPKKLTNALDTIFGTGLYFHNTQLFFNPTNKNKKPYWHRDLQYSPIEDTVQQQELNNMLSLHVRIPIVDEKGIELIPGSHTRWDTQLEKNVRFELDGHRQFDPLPNAQRVDLAIGDILVFHSQMLHRGIYELSEERKALDICTGTPNVLTKGFLDPNVLPRKGELKAIDNKCWYKRAIELALETSS